MHAAKEIKQQATKACLASISGDTVLAQNIYNIAVNQYSDNEYITFLDEIEKIKVQLEKRIRSLNTFK